MAEDSYEARAAARAAKRASRFASMPPAQQNQSQYDQPPQPQVVDETETPAKLSNGVQHTDQVDQTASPSDKIEISVTEHPSEEPKSEEPQSEEPKSEEPQSEEPKSEEPHSEEPHSEEPQSEEPQSEEPKSEEPQFEEPKSEENKSEEIKSEEPKLEEPKSEEIKSEEPKSEEPKTSESNSLTVPADEEFVPKTKRYSKRFGDSESSTPPAKSPPSPVPSSAMDKSNHSTSSRPSARTSTSESKTPVSSPTPRNFARASVFEPKSNTTSSSSSYTRPPVSTEKLSSISKKFEPGSSSAVSVPDGEKKPRPAVGRVALDVQVDENSEAAKLVKKIVDLDEEVSWALFDVQAGQLTVYKSGNGTVDDLRKNLEHTNALYGYVRMPVGAEQRQKFVFIRWVGDKITPMTRARILNNEAVAKKIIKIFHIEIPTSFLDELTAAKVAQRLAKAGGANYDKDQNEGTFQVKTSNTFNSYKNQSKDFFALKERETTLKGVVYTKHAMAKTTPVDLSSRPMTAPATAAKKNTILEVPGVDKPK